MPKNVYESLYARLVAHTAEPENGQACWAHDGMLNKPNGYPRITLWRDGKHAKDYPHRLMWMEFNGTIPEGHEIDHRCHNHRCINPDHLRLLPIPHNRAKNKKPVY